MKKAKIMLAAIALVAVVGGGAAVKAAKFGSTVTIGNTCNIAVNPSTCAANLPEVGYTTLQNANSVVFTATIPGGLCSSDADCKKSVTLYKAL